MKKYKDFIDEFDEDTKPSKKQIKEYHDHKKEKKLRGMFTGKNYSRLLDYLEDEDD